MKRNRRLFYDGFRIAMAYVGTVVGAGFATGQEYCNFYPIWLPFIGRFDFRHLFIAVGRRIMFYAGKLGADPTELWQIIYLEKPLPLSTSTWGAVLICGAMFAGQGPFQEQWGSYLFGASVTARGTSCHLVWCR